VAEDYEVADSDLASGSCQLVNAIAAEVILAQACQNGDEDACAEDIGFGGEGDNSGVDGPEEQITVVEVVVKASISMDGLVVPEDEDSKVLLGKVLSKAIANILTLSPGSEVVILSVGGVPFTNRRLEEGADVVFEIHMQLDCADASCSSAEEDASAAIAAAEAILVTATGDDCGANCFSRESLIAAQAAIMADEGMGEDEIAAATADFEALVADLVVTGATVDAASAEIGEPEVISAGDGAPETDDGAPETDDGIADADDLDGDVLDSGAVSASSKYTVKALILIAFVASGVLA
jgi:hypothetical protein